MSDLTYIQSVILGVVEGITEYLPISSTAHLTITEKLMGFRVDDAAVTAYTAVIQLGAIAATLLYFAKDFVRLFLAWVGGLRDETKRHAHDYALAWAVIVGSIPVALVGLALKKVIEGPLRSLWVIGFALILWSAVIYVAERRHAKLVSEGAERDEGAVTVKDGLMIGLVQCFSVIPGVSRSGATISAGLFRGLNRVTATRLSFFLAIPALTAAGLYEGLKTDFSGMSKGPMAVGVIVAFVVAYAAIAWLLRFVASNSLMSFVWYRIAAGVVILGLLATSVLQAT